MKSVSTISTLIFILCSTLFAQIPDEIYTSQVINPYQSVKPGDTIHIATKIIPLENWKGYYLNPGANGLAPEITWKEEQNLKFQELLFPPPKSKKGDFGYEYYYPEEYWIFSKFQVPADAKPGDYILEHEESITICEIGGQCVLGENKKTEISLNIGSETLFNPNSETFQQKLNLVIRKDALDLNASATADGLELTIELQTEQEFDTAQKYIFIPSESSNNLKNPEIQLEKTDLGYSFSFILPNNHSANDHIAGILSLPEGPISTSIPAIPIDAQIAGKLTEAKEKKLNWTQKEKEEHAKLYKADTKIITDAGDPTTQSIGTILIFAFLGGMILNLMPCVFPVLGLKVLGFAQLAGNDPKKIKIHGLIFTLGVVLSMWILAGALLALSATTKISWGEQMGNPIFVGSIIILLFMMGLNMYGVFEFGTSLTSAGGNMQNKKGYSGSLFSGILTTLIATPCSGPFLGATMSYALTQSASVSLMIFTVFALGISFPYLALAFAPALINKLPKPGAWMEVFKKFMAFPLFATSVFFLKAFGGQTGNNGMYLLSMSLVLFGFAAWAYGTWNLPFISKQKRYIWGLAFPLVIVGSATWLSSTAMNQKAAPHFVEGWQQWHPGIVEHHVSKKRAVWVDYTADW